MIVERALFEWSPGADRQIRSPRMSDARDRWACARGGRNCYEKTDRQSALRCAFLDPLVMGGVTLLLGITAFAACVVPVRRASRVDPGPSRVR